MSEKRVNRIYPDEDGRLRFPGEGELSVGQDQDGIWWFKHPKERLASLEDHEVTEDAQGNVTVFPSIQGDVIHGFLQAGIWKDC